MSSLHFTATLHVDDTHPLLALLQQSSTLTETHWRNEWQHLDLDDDFVAELLSEKISLTVEQDRAWLEIDAGSDVSLDFFIELMSLIEQLEVEQYNARLFDTASGGCQVWDQPELEIEINEARVCLLGEFDPDGEVAESLEKSGAMRVDTLDDCTLAVVGFAADPDMLKDASRRCIPIISEEALHDYLF